MSISTLKTLQNILRCKCGLEGGDGAPKDLELWGFEKPSYTFNDLDAYMKEKDKPKAKKGKGKAKKDDETEEKGKKKKGEKKKGKM